MKSGLVLTLFLLFQAVLFGQSIDKATLRVGSKDISYAMFLDHSLPSAVLFSIVPTDSTIAEPAEWMQRIYPVAEKNGWKAIAISGDVQHMDKAWSKVKSQFFQSVDSMPPPSVYLLMEGNALGHIQTFSEEVVVPDGVVVINPLTGKGGANAWMNDTPLAVVFRDSVSKEFKDSLLRAGVWWNQFQLELPGLGTEMAHLPVLDRAFTWCDSLSRGLKDSLQRAQLGASIGLTNTIPETVREGRNVKVEVFVPNPADCRFELTDLAGKSVWKMDGFYGRGSLLFSVPTRGLNWGVYQFKVEVDHHINQYKIIIRG